MTGPRFVLVGGGIAAVTTAAHLRKNSFDGEIAIIAEESVAPYQRPPLSKEFLAGTSDDVLLQDNDWYAKNGVDLLLGTKAEWIDVANRWVTLSTGEQLRYDALVLATGVRPRRLAGFSGERVHYLRTLPDSQRLRAQLAQASRMVVLGAGFVGCEVAAVACAQGKEVTILEPEAVPLGRALGAGIGAVLGKIHRDRGVVLRTGEYATAMEENSSGVVLTTNTGDQLEADLVVVGIGCEPNVELAVEAGLATGNGILADDLGRTSAPNIYAIGDVAARRHPSYADPVRVEHHDTAQRHGIHLAKALTGAAEPFAEAPWFWSDQYEHTVQSVGRLRDPADLVVRGSLEAADCTAFSLVDGHILGAVGVNRAGEILQVRRMMAGSHEVTAAQLRDDSVPLKRLNRATAKERSRS